MIEMTLEITEQKDVNPLLWYSEPSIVPAQALPDPGGLPVFKDGRLIGALGLGGAPDEDHECTLAGPPSFNCLTMMRIVIQPFPSSTKPNPDHMH